MKLNKRIPPEMLISVAPSTTPRLADTIVANLALKLTDQQELLETDPRAGSSACTS